MVSTAEGDREVAKWLDIEESNQIKVSINVF